MNLVTVVEPANRELNGEKKACLNPKPSSWSLFVVTESRWEGEERREKAGSQPAGPRERLRIHCAI